MDNPHYAKLESNDDEALLGISSKQRDQLFTLRTALMTVCLAIAAFISGLLINAFPNKDAMCASHTVLTSPLLDELPITYTTKTFNGSFMHPNIYRQDAGPEVDSAWEALGVDYRSITVPEEKAKEAGLRDDHVKISEKYGGGYPVNVEGLHHLHCLNLLRQSLYYNFDHYHAIGKGAFKNNDRILKLHVTHCLDILRQQLMCTVDLGVFGQVWINPEEPTSFVDFNTQHTCKNFDAVRQWAQERQLPEDVPKDFLEPPIDASVILPETP